MFLTIGIILSDFILTPALESQAYLDPGSGSFIIQLAIGAIVGALVALKVYWSKVRSFFTKSAEENPAGTTEGKAPETTQNES